MCGLFYFKRAASRLPRLPQQIDQPRRPELIEFRGCWWRHRRYSLCQPIRSQLRSIGRQRSQHRDQGDLLKSLNMRQGLNLRGGAHDGIELVFTSAQHPSEGCGTNAREPLRFQPEAPCSREESTPSRQHA